MRASCMQCIRHSLEHTTSQQPTPARHERIFLEKFIFAPEESHRSNRCLKVHTAPSVHWSPQRDDSAWSLTGTLFKLGHLPVIRQLTPGGLHQQSDVAPCRLRDASRSGDFGWSAPTQCCFWAFSPPLSLHAVLSQSTQRSYCENRRNLSSLLAR
jgi:hypothetical protein